MSKKNYIIKSILFALLVFFLVNFSISIPYDLLYIMDENMVLTKTEFEKILQNNFSIFGTINAAAVNGEIDDSDIEPYIVRYKLFNLFNVKELKVNVTNNSKIYPGGECLGFSLNSNGAIIVGSNYVITRYGKLDPFGKSGLLVGDIITSINGMVVNGVEDITTYMENYNVENSIELIIIRNGEKVTINITPALDIQTHSYKLGLWLKDTCAGIGTLTYINGDNDDFGALGHAVTTSDNQEPFNICGGELYNCKIVGVKSGKNGKAGQLLGVFSLNDKIIGKITDNTKYGVYGKLTDYDELLKGKSAIEVGGKVTAKPGQAKILSCIDGENIEEFDIEIIKTNYQKSSNEKSMVIRVIDKELLARTGGIVQGMSGSPIIQDGKLIGAVTHVFINDPSKGFGLYIDWMM